MEKEAEGKREKHQNQQQEVYEEDEAFVFEIVTASNFKETGEAWARINSTAEPAALHLGLTYEQHLAAWPEAFAAIPKQGLSLVARDKQSGRLVAFRLAVDLHSESGLQHWLVSTLLLGGMAKGFRLAHMLCPETLKPAAAMPWLINLTVSKWREATAQNNNARSALGPSQVLHMYGVGVEDGFTGKGLATRITGLTERLAREKGFRLSLVACSNAISAHVFANKLGYAERARVCYDELVFNGEHVFGGMMNRRKDGQERYMIVMDKEL
ncbi:hypothetical protein QOT17_007514 [Balamuthia mandrillaris]